MAQKKGGGNKAFWPLIGFILAVALGVLGYALAPVVINAVPDLRFGSLTGDQLRLAVAGIIFLILGAIVVMILAFAAPKRNPMDQITEKSLQEQRLLRNKRRLAKKQREADMKRQARKR
ncbi:MAG: hypothetical protein H6672_19430 [Anaerolineaceae bacterium]|nr:hypothetical protein [Anaerolineaceae bacterium]